MRKTFTFLTIVSALMLSACQSFTQTPPGYSATAAHEAREAKFARFNGVYSATVQTKGKTDTQLDSELVSVRQHIDATNKGE